MLKIIPLHCVRRWDLCEHLGHRLCLHGQINTVIKEDWGGGGGFLPSIPLPVWSRDIHLLGRVKLQPCFCIDLGVPLKSHLLIYSSIYLLWGTHVPLYVWRSEDNSSEASPTLPSCFEIECLLFLLLHNWASGWLSCLHLYKSVGIIDAMHLSDLRGRCFYLLSHLPDPFSLYYYGKWISIWLFIYSLVIPYLNAMCLDQPSFPSFSSS